MHSIESIDFESIGFIESIGNTMVGVGVLVEFVGESILNGGGDSMGWK